MFLIEYQDGEYVNAEMIDYIRVDENGDVSFSTNEAGMYLYVEAPKVKEFLRKIKHLDATSNSGHSGTSFGNHEHKFNDRN